MTDDTPHDTEPATVLVVEDERSLADMYTVFLDSAYSVRTAYDGREALDSIHDDVDVVLLDRRMPGLSGEEVLEEIRAVGYDCRVAMITAVPPDYDILEMPFDVYLMKPVDREILLDTVELLVELGAAEDLLQEYYRLVSTKIALELEKDHVDFGQNAEFGRLSERATELEADLDVNEARTAEDTVRGLLE